MVAFDVMPLASEHGGHSRIESYNRAAVPTYRIGEWVLITAGAPSTLQEQPEALGGANYVSAVNRIAAEDGLNDFTRIADPRYVPPPVGARGKGDSCYVLTQDTEFVTRNAFNGDNVNVGPAGTNDAALVQVGDIVGMHVTSVPTTVLAIHGIDVGDTGLVITRLLDALGRDSAISGAATDRIVFRANI